MSTEQNQPDDVKKLREMIKGIDIGMLTTCRRRRHVAQQAHVDQWRSGV
ncbi:MAG: hypothetical protein WKF84_13325 [Pyrinomonadaceae bacterium]